MTTSAYQRNKIVVFNPVRLVDVITLTSQLDETVLFSRVASSDLIYTVYGRPSVSLQKMT